MRKQVGDRSFKFVDSLLALLIVSAATCGLAFAQERRTGGRTPSAEGAAVYFIDLKDGASVPTKVTIRFGLREMGVVPAGFDRENSGHHHLLIDTELPPLFEPIPNDFNHLHFGGGQTEAQVTLKPGPHTLQLLLGDKDHIPHNPPVMSSRIRIIVSNVTTASPQVASTAVRAQAPRPTKAQEKAIRSACLKDYMSHCSKVKPGPAGLACLKSNAASLSAGCQTALSAAGGESAAAGVAPASQGAPAPTKATLTPTQATPASAQDAGSRIGTPRPTKAQEKAIRSACLKDYMSHCSKVKPGPAGLACLKSNAASLSAGCQTALSAAGGGSAAAGIAPASQGAPAPTQATLAPTQAMPAPAQDAGGRIGTPRPTKAQEKAIRSACLKDYMSHCSKVKAGPAGLACLKSNAASLSARCQTALSAVGGGSREAAATPAAHRASATSSPYARLRRLLRQWRQRY